jgi:hypothetical protein
MVDPSVYRPAAGAGSIEITWLSVVFSTETEKNCRTPLSGRRVSFWVTA